MTSTLDIQSPSAPVSLDSRLAGVLFEAKLRDWNLSYEYNEKFALDSLRVEDWAQVRHGETLTKDKIAEFRTLLRQGVVFPPVIVMAPDLLVDGGGRVHSARAEHIKIFPAFVVQFSSVDLAKSFAAACNQMGGERLTSQEAAEAAAIMMERGMADEAIAREIGRSASSVRDMRRQFEFDERAARIKGLSKAARALSGKAQIKLVQIPHDPAFAAAVKLAAEAGGRIGTVNEIVQAAKSAHDDTSAVAAVESKRAELAPAGPPPRGMVVPAEVRQARMHLSGLNKLGAGNPVAMLDTVDEEHRARAISQWRYLGELSGTMLGLYGEK